MAKSKKTGRGRKSKIDMSSEAGRMMLKDLINFKKTGYNPFDSDTFMIETFWKSRNKFPEVSFGAFKYQAKNGQCCYCANA